MNFEATPERIARLDEQTAFANLAKSKKRKDEVAAEQEIAEGRKRQETIRAALATLEGNGRYMDREAFEADVVEAAKSAGLKFPATIRKAIFAALGERDPDAEICRDGKGRPEPDGELRDTENIPLPPDTALPVPMEFGPDKPNDRLITDLPGRHRRLYGARGGAPCARRRGSTTPRPESATKSRSTGTFTCTSRRARSIRSRRDITKLEGEIAGLLKGLVA